MIDWSLSFMDPKKKKNSYKKKALVLVEIRNVYRFARLKIEKNCSESIKSAIEQ